MTERRQLAKQNLVLYQTPILRNSRAIVAQRRRAACATNYCNGPVVTEHLREGKGERQHLAISIWHLAKTGMAVVSLGCLQFAYRDSKLANLFGTTSNRGFSPNAKG